MRQFRLVYQWCSVDLRTVLLVFVSVLFCVLGPRDQLQRGTNVLSRSPSSILLLALCTAGAILVKIIIFQILSGFLRYSLEFISA